MELVSLAVLLFGLAWAGGFAFVHFRAVAKAKASETWPTAVGRIVSSDVVVEESWDEDGTTTWYDPLVVYSYSAGGPPLEGRRVRFANLRKGSRRKAEEIVGKYRAGSPVTVRYNPARPEESVLETAKPGPLYLVMALGGLVFVAAGFFIGSMP